MKIGTNHLLEGAVTDAVGDLTGGGRAMPTRRCVVLHFTAGATGRSSIGWWKQLKNRRIDLGAHFVVERTGEIIQCRACDRTISHAGTSLWVDPKTGKRFPMTNGYGIGIEIANAGDNSAIFGTVSRLPGFAGLSANLRHRNGGVPRQWEIYGEAQMAAVTQLCQALVARYNLDDVTGHDCISPGRKVDPGPAFPMEQVREACGFQGLPVVHR